jgi:hypothetical protein
MNSWHLCMRFPTCASGTRLHTIVFCENEIPDMTNVEFDLAEQFALYTRKHCFITGKAGTGKTTLLKRIAEQTRKNVIVAAPTGVAAINAGGVTIHSMFGLPLTCFVPGDDFVDLNLATNRLRLRQDHIHFRKDKLSVLRELDTLIIDEVSMVRCDVLDAVDFVMRTARRNERPFGNVQVLLFGDLHQLPPVVKDPEWNILQKYYGSPYFFDSLVWKQLDAAEIELQTIYRQSDAGFLNLLSHIRNHEMNPADYEQLRTRYNPDFRPAEKGFVLLTTHNYRADTVNASELAKLPGRLHSFEAEIDGEFPNNMFPCDLSLQLKVGAQVMFIRNDTEESRYYNGKLAVVKKIDKNDITVTFSDTGEEYPLHRETWDNIDYAIEKESGELVRNELGAFSQFPLRLAWAITIHKSQGLTFDKVIIDAGRSFAAGQVYVALSRCRSLEGIVLHSLIPPTALHSDARISEFSAAHHGAEALQAVFVRERVLYAQYQVLRIFAFAALSRHLGKWQELLEKKDIPEKEAACALQERVAAHVREIDDIAEKFQRQLERIMKSMETDPGRIAMLKERCTKAIEYFTERIASQIAAPLHTHINGLAYKKKMKAYLAQVQLIEDTCWRKVNQLYQSRFLEEKLYNGELIRKKEQLEQVVSSATSGRKEKGGTFKDTLDLYRQGKDAAEIAVIRGLTVGTIKQHLARWISAGNVDVYELLPAEMVDSVVAFMEENKGCSATSIRIGLDSKYDYADIRMIMSHVLRSAQSAGRTKENHSDTSE